MSVLQWDTTAANNDDADAAINWAEGQAPSTVNNSARAMMAELRKWYLDSSGSIVAGGTANALTLTTNMLPTAHAQPLLLAFEASATNTGATTVTIDSLTSRDIKRTDGTALRSGDITSGGIYLIAYEAGIDDYLLLNPNMTGTEAIVVPVTTELQVVAAGAGKRVFRMPYAFTLTGVRASLATAQTSGTLVTVDINETAGTILSTKLTIDNTEKTSTTALTAAVISDVALANDAEITIDVDSIGDGTAKGLVVTMIGYRA